MGPGQSLCGAWAEPGGARAEHGQSPAEPSKAQVLFHHSTLPCGAISMLPPWVRRSVWLVCRYMYPQLGTTIFCAARPRGRCSATRPWVDSTRMRVGVGMHSGMPIKAPVNTPVPHVPCTTRAPHQYGIIPLAATTSYSRAWDIRSRQIRKLDGFEIRYARPWVWSAFI